jgi:hypothetical protein
MDLIEVYVEHGVAFPPRQHWFSAAQCVPKLQRMKVWQTCILVPEVPTLLNDQAIRQSLMGGFSTQHQMVTMNWKPVRSVWTGLIRLKLDRRLNVRLVLGSMPERFEEPPWYCESWVDSVWLRQSNNMQQQEGGKINRIRQTGTIVSRERTEYVLFVSHQVLKIDRVSIKAIYNPYQILVW